MSYQRKMATGAHDAAFTGGLRARPRAPRRGTLAISRAQGLRYEFTPPPAPYAAYAACAPELRLASTPPRACDSCSPMPMMNVLLSYRCGLAVARCGNELGAARATAVAASLYTADDDILRFFIRLEKPAS